MRLIPIGPDAVLAELAADDPAEGGATAAASLAAWARGRVAAREIVPAARTVLFDGVTGQDLAAELADWRITRPRAGAQVDVLVEFDGPDLDSVAAATGLSAADVVDLVTSAELMVAFCGFAPGFAYLTGLPGVLHLPRRATPRTRVEPGSVAIAGEYAGIYPTASPGGWHLIGRTDAPLWDATRPEPALLPPGTSVRLRAR